MLVFSMFCESHALFQALRRNAVCSDVQATSLQRNYKWCVNEIQTAEFPVKELFTQETRQAFGMFL